MRGMAQIRGCPRNCKRRADAECHWADPGKAARRRRPASQETCRQQMSSSKPGGCPGRGAWLLELERVPPEHERGRRAAGTVARFAAVTILVCRTCRDAAGSDAEPRPGERLAAGPPNAARRPRHRGRRGRMPRQLQAPADGRHAASRRLELRVRRPHRRQRRRPGRRRAAVRRARPTACCPGAAGPTV